jgi:lipopolysaccharide assembly outer membrane protein LptD (OstA)
MSLAGTVAGCLPSGPVTKKPQPKQKASVKTGIQMNLNTDPASAVVYSSEPPRIKLWTVSWQQMSAALDAKGISSGRMKVVHGTLLSGSATGTSVTSEEGVGDEVKKILRLYGHVIVLSPDKKSKLACDSLKYDSRQQLFYAEGNVKILNSVGSIGTFSQLIASADFKKFGTPKDFALK